MVTCTADKTAVDTDTVAAQPDGVHLTVADESGRELLVRSEYLGDRDDHASEPIGVLAGEHVVQARPGRYLVLCSEQDGPEHMLAPSETDEAVALEVTDPSDSWVAGELECDSDTFSHQIRDYAASADTGARPTHRPEDAVRADASVGARASDVIELAGYPERTLTDGVTVRVVRDGEVRAVVGLRPSNRQWRVGSVWRCGDG